MYIKMSIFKIFKNVCFVSKGYAAQTMATASNNETQENGSKLN